MAKPAQKSATDVGVDGLRAELATLEWESRLEHVKLSAFVPATAVDLCSVLEALDWEDRLRCVRWLIDKKGLEAATWSAADWTRVLDTLEWRVRGAFLLDLVMRPSRRRAHCANGSEHWTRDEWIGALQKVDWVDRLAVLKSLLKTSAHAVRDATLARLLEPQDRHDFLEALNVSTLASGTDGSATTTASCATTTAEALPANFGPVSDRDEKAGAEKTSASSTSCATSQTTASTRSDEHSVVYCMPRNMVTPSAPDKEPEEPVVTVDDVLVPLVLLDQSTH